MCARRVRTLGFPQDVPNIKADEVKTPTKPQSPEENIKPSSREDQVLPLTPWDQAPASIPENQPSLRPEQHIRSEGTSEPLQETQTRPNQEKPEEHQIQRLPNPSVDHPNRVAEELILEETQIGNPMVNTIFVNGLEKLIWEEKLGSKAALKRAREQFSTGG